MKSGIINLLKISISGIIALVLLSGFCLIYDYSGCHITNKDGSTDYKRESNQFFSTMKEGFAWFRFDKNGFNNENDSSFDEHPIDILVIGSSHMEAVQMKPGENAAAILNRLLPEYRTYNIGISGHNIYTCIQNMPFASSQYKPRKYVILETYTVNLSIDSMTQVLENTFPEIPSHESGIAYYAQKSVPAIKSLYKAVTNWKSVSSWYTDNSSTPSEIQNNNDNNEMSQDKSLEYEKALDRFLYKASTSIPAHCDLIIFYLPDAVLDENGNYKKKITLETELFSQICEKYGIIFVDMTNSFENLYCTKHILPYGFSNTATGTGHLNQYGHQVIAISLAKVIKEKEEK